MREFFFCGFYNVSVDKKRLAKFKEAWDAIRNPDLKKSFEELYKHLGHDDNFADLGIHTRSVTNTILDDFTELANKVNDGCEGDNNYMKKFDKYWDRFQVNTKLRIAIVGILSLITFGALAAIFVFAPPAALTVAAVGLAVGSAALHTTFFTGIMAVADIATAYSKSKALLGQQTATTDKINPIIEAIKARRKSIP